MQGAAATPIAAAKIRNGYDTEWIDRHVGPWLEKYFHSDVEAIVDANNHLIYSHALDPADADTDIDDLMAQLAPCLDFLRGRLNGPPSHTIAVLEGQDPAMPGRSTVLMQRFRDKLAFISAVAVGSDAELAKGNAEAPIVLSVKYLSRRLLNSVGTHLQLAGLHTIDNPAQAGSDRVMELLDPQGGTIARFAWTPTKPGAAVVQSVVPFIAVALAGFALLVGLVIRHMRRTSQEIDAGERQLRHLALHDLRAAYQSIVNVANDTIGVTSLRTCQCVSKRDLGFSGMTGWGLPPRGAFATLAPTNIRSGGTYGWAKSGIGDRSRHRRGTRGDAGADEGRLCRGAGRPAQGHAGDGRPRGRADARRSAHRAD
ncbi:MAG: CHASE4 domain-containing protein [Xanthobacteraceae bacterium]